MDGSWRWHLSAAAATLLALCARSALAASDGLPGYIPPNGGSQFMLYVSHALGARGHEALRFGLRYENATPASSDPAFRFCAPLRHRTLVDFQLARGSAPRLVTSPIARLRCSGCPSARPIPARRGSTRRSRAG